MRIIFTAVCAFALGVLVRDVAQDYVKKPDYITKRDAACERAKENAERFAKALVHLLNQKTVELQGATISCRVKHHEEKSWTT